MEKKKSEKLQEQVKPKKQRAKATEVETYVDKALTYVGIGQGRNYNWDTPIAINTNFDDVPYEVSYDGGVDIPSISKKISEAAAYKAIIKNKKFRSTIDGIAKQMAEDLVSNTIGATKQIEQDRIYEEQDRIYEEKNAKELAARQAKQAEEKKIKEEQLKKEKAQKLIFMEGLNLTAGQKKAFKKFYKVDIDKV